METQWNTTGPGGNPSQTPSTSIWCNSYRVHSNRLALVQCRHLTGTHPNQELGNAHLSQKKQIPLSPCDWETHPKIQKIGKIPLIILISLGNSPKNCQRITGSIKNRSEFQSPKAAEVQIVIGSRARKRRPQQRPRALSIPVTRGSRNLSWHDPWGTHPLSFEHGVLKFGGKMSIRCNMMDFFLNFFPIFFTVLFLFSSYIFFPSFFPAFFHVFFTFIFFIVLFYFLSCHELPTPFNFFP